MGGGRGPSKCDYNINHMSKMKNQETQMLWKSSFEKRVVNCVSCRHEVISEGDERRPLALKEAQVILKKAVLAEDQNSITRNYRVKPWRIWAAFLRGGWIKDGLRLVKGSFVCGEHERVKSLWKGRKVGKKRQLEMEKGLVDHGGI
jgi:hypothetical protein